MISTSRSHPTGLKVTIEAPDGLEVRVAFHDGSSNDLAPSLADIVLLGVLNPPLSETSELDTSVLFGEITFSSEDVTSKITDSVSKSVWDLSFFELGVALSRGVSVLLSDPLPPA
jgi:hypothetical protein